MIIIEETLFGFNELKWLQSFDESEDVIRFVLQQLYAQMMGWA